MLLIAIACFFVAVRAPGLALVDQGLQVLDTECTLVLFVLDYRVDLDFAVGVIAKFGQHFLEFLVVCEVLH